MNMEIYWHKLDIKIASTTWDKSSMTSSSPTNCSSSSDINSYHHSHHHKYPISQSSWVLNKFSIKSLHWNNSIHKWCWNNFWHASSSNKIGCLWSALKKFLNWEIIFISIRHTFSGKVGKLRIMSSRNKENCFASPTKIATWTPQSNTLGFW